MNCMKRLSVTGDTAGRRITNGASYVKRVSGAGASITAGGMSASGAGTMNTTGTTTIATEFRATALAPVRVSVRKELFIGVGHFAGDASGFGFAPDAGDGDSPEGD